MADRIELPAELRDFLLDRAKMPAEIFVDKEKYTLDFPVGSGYKGAVWKVIDKLGRARALKLATLEDYQNRSYLEETQRAAKLEQEEGIEAVLGRKEQLNRRQKRLDGQGEAHPVSSTGQALVALACGEPPLRLGSGQAPGRASWTLKLLADRLVEGEIVESISPETVRQTLKKTNSSPG